MSPAPLSTILVNGANGKLGRTVVAALGQRSWRAGVRRASDRYPDPLIVPDNGRVSPDGLVGIDAIVNCAGQVQGSVEDVRRANVEHAVALATAARGVGVRRFVQVSSFSVYGSVEKIGPNSPRQPDGEYGRSKVAAEQALAELSTDDFSVFVLRLPFMFDREQPALVGRTIDLLERLPAFPVAPSPVARSMLTYGDAATLLISAVDAPLPDGPVPAADPMPFTFEKLVAMMRHHRLRTARLIPMPPLATAIISRVSPTVSRRLFTSSLLQADANWAADRVLPFGIMQEMDAVVATMSRANAK